MGNLQRLFTYSKSGVEAREDFTTEALAIAMRHDPSPWLEVVRAAGLMPTDFDPRSVIPHTQYIVQAVGRIDLVLQYVDEKGGMTEQWIEIKVDSPESGNQIDRYRAHLSSVPPDIRPTLATIAKKPIRPDPTLAWIKWQTLFRAAKRSGSGHWSDLAEWLEEIGMAGDHDTAVTADELRGLIGAKALYDKLGNVLQNVCELGRVQWPALDWPTGGAAIKAELRSELDGRGALTIALGQVNRRGGLYLGAWNQRGDPWLGLWIDQNPTDGPLRRRLMQLGSALPEPWHAPNTDPWFALAARIDPADGLDQPDLIDWYVARLGDLDNAGILGLLPFQPHQL